MHHYQFQGMRVLFLTESSNRLKSSEGRLPANAVTCLMKMGVSTEIGDLIYNLTQFIIRMSIVQLLEIQGYILAVSDAGWMHMWNLKEIKKVQGVYVFKNNISLVPSKGQIKIDGNSLTGLQYHNNTIIAHNKEIIYISSFPNILNCFKEERSKSIITLNTSTFLEKKESINSLLISDDTTLIIATNKANVYHYNYEQSQVIAKNNLNQSSKPENQQLAVFMTTPQPTCEINCIGFYGNKQFLVAGLSNGKIYALRTEDLQIAYELSASVKNQAFDAIQHLVVADDGQKVFCLHENYITEWSIKLGSCLSYIDYQHPRGLLSRKNGIVIIGSHHKLIWYNNGIRQLKLSMRSARVIKQIGNDLIAIGGADGIIDIVIGEMRLMTLFQQR